MSQINELNGREYCSYHWSMELAAFAILNHVLALANGDVQVYHVPFKAMRYITFTNYFSEAFNKLINTLTVQDVEYKQ